MARNWTTLEIKALRRHYPERGPKWPGWSEILPGRSAGAISNKAAALGVERTTPAEPTPESKTPWTVEEDAEVLELYPVHGPGWPGWAAALPGRTKRAVSKRAYDLGVKGPLPSVARASAGSDWGNSERRELLVALGDVARRLGRSADECIKEAARLSEAWRGIR